MAETAKELAFALFDQGKRPSDPELKELGIKSRSLYTYFQLWKKKTPPDGSTHTTTHPKSGSGIEVGKITITPENWGFTQYGAILVLDTYNKAKRDIDYGGTIGDFICDITEFYRRIVNYKEVEHGRAISEGRGGAEENGRPSPEPEPESVEA